MYKVTIPKWTNNKTGEYYPERICSAMLIETLLANSPQPPELIKKYYGEDAPSGVYKPSPHDRLVFWSVNYGYIIIPNTPQNRSLWNPPNNLS